MTKRLVGAEYVQHFKNADLPANERAFVDDLLAKASEDGRMDMDRMVAIVRMHVEKNLGAPPHTALFQTAQVLDDYSGIYQELAQEGGDFAETHAEAALGFMCYAHALRFEQCARVILEIRKATEKGNGNLTKTERKRLGELCDSLVAMLPEIAGNSQVA